jgi:steroid 5-alpha reductase family enzyme
LDAIGVVLWLIGFAFESGGDWQLARFQADPANRGRVLDQGFWRYTRHPNYFGDFCVWWGLYAIAAAGGAWSTMLSPIVMSVLLLKVSGVALLEKSIGERAGICGVRRRTTHSSRTTTQLADRRNVLVQHLGVVFAPD